MRNKAKLPLTKKEEFKLAWRWMRECKKAHYTTKLSEQIFEVNSLLRDITGRFEVNFAPSTPWGLASESQYEKSRKTGRRVLKGPWLNFKRFCQFEKTGIPVSW